MRAEICTTCRLGASLALKQCAAALAREPDLADEYMLQALQQVVLALRAAEADPAGTGTRQQAAEAMQVPELQHLAHTSVPCDNLEGEGLVDIMSVWFLQASPMRQIDRTQGTPVASYNINCAFEISIHLQFLLHPILAVMLPG